MKSLIRISLLLTAAALFAGTLQAQSLGDVARENRKMKRATTKKVVTNEDLRSTSVTSDSSGDAAAASDAPAEAPAESAAAPSADALKAKEAEWKAKFAEQKKMIAQLEREADVLERENRLRAATFYGDAGARLRDEKKFAEDDRRYKADIDAKKAEAAAAKQRLEEMQDEARRDGMPSSVAD